MQAPADPHRHRDAEATARGQLGVCIRNYGEVLAPDSRRLRGLQQWVRDLLEQDQ